MKKENLNDDQIKILISGLALMISKVIITPNRMKVRCKPDNDKKI